MSAEDGNAPRPGASSAVLEGSPPPLLLGGPTAVGKSALALALAERIEGEIVSVDSMQVYAGMDIGTAKPTPEERRRVPHHLLDILDLRESFDVGRFVALARQAVADIQRRGRTPILCGGTGLYFKAFLEGLAGLPPADSALRTSLEATPLETLLVELRERDPVAFARIDRRNLRRVVRAIEVIRLTGRPFSAFRADWGDPAPGPLPASAADFFCFERSAEDLHARIDARVEAMFNLGLVAETERLLGAGLADNKTALQALGYRQVVEHLRGLRTLPETVQEVKQRTREFARRQMTWFRHQPGIRWVRLAPGPPPEQLVETLELAASAGSAASGNVGG